MGDIAAPEMTRNSQYAYFEALTAALRGSSGDWLDLGCGHGFMPEWFPVRAVPIETWNPVGIDPDYAALRRHRGLRWRVRAVGEGLPFRDAIFDLVTANMVIEHVADPTRLFREVRRVLKPTGMCLIHTPNRWGYTTVLARLIPNRILVPLTMWLLRRRAEDIYPTHYRANTVADLTRLAAETGLRIHTCVTVSSSPQFFRLGPIGRLEDHLIRALQRPALNRFQVCLLAELRPDRQS